jgi:hypothetical protein
MVSLNNQPEVIAAQDHLGIAGLTIYDGDPGRFHRVYEDLLRVQNVTLCLGIHEDNIRKVLEATDLFGRFKDNGKEPYIGSGMVREIAFNKDIGVGPEDRGNTRLTFTEWRVRGKPMTLTPEQSEHYMDEGAVATGVDLPTSGNRAAALFDRRFIGGTLTHYAETSVDPPRFLERGKVKAIRQIGERGVFIDADRLELDTNKIQMGRPCLEGTFYFTVGSHSSYLLAEPGVKTPSPR